MGTQTLKVPLTKPLGPSCSIEIPQSKVLAYHRHNSTPPPAPGFFATIPLQTTSCFSSKTAKLVERYNRHAQPRLQAGDTVTIQNPLNRRWNTTGKIISALPERQYKIRVDGSGRIRHLGTVASSKSAIQAYTNPDTKCDTRTKNPVN